jgi:AcrR family transcriptional regulator
MSVARVSRISYHHGNLEEALITSAIKLIRKHGPDNLSLRAVASDLGVSPSAAYHYFPDKDSLIHGVGDHLFAELAQMMEKSLEKFPGKNIKATKSRFREIGRAYFTWASKEPNLFRLLFGGFCSMDRGKSHKEDSSFKILEKTLDELVECGAMPKKLRPYGEVLAWTSVQGAVTLILEGHLPKSSFDDLLDGLELALGVKP